MKGGNGLIGDIVTSTSRNPGHARVVSTLPGRFLGPRGIVSSKPCIFCGGERWTHTSNDFCRSGKVTPTDSATRAYRKTPMRYHPIVKLGSFARSMVSLQHCLKQACAILPSSKTSSRRQSDWSAGAQVPIMCSVPAQSRFANPPSRFYQVARGIVLRHCASTGGL